jgi:hypothetical protein
MSAIHHFLIKKNKIHHLDRVNISELQSEHLVVACHPPLLWICYAPKLGTRTESEFESEQCLKGFVIVD